MLGYIVLILALAPGAYLLWNKYGKKPKTGPAVPVSPPAEVKTTVPDEKKL